MMKKKPKQETRFEYKGYPCVVLFQPFGFRCGYVGLPKENKYYGKTYGTIPVKCHWGLTYGRPYLSEQPNENTWWIGFDCGHYGDAYDYEKAIEYFGDSEMYEILKEENVALHGTVKTLDFAILECKEIVEQLIELEGRQNGKKA